MPAPSLLDRIDPWLKLSQWTYRVPTHSRSFLYSLGGIVLFGFMMMIATGLVLAQLYNPAPEQAYESLQKIQQIGWASYFRALHYWTAQGMIVALLLHVARVFMTGAYQYPRQVTWWAGVALLAIMLMGSYFSGTILKWDEEGITALSHYKEALHALGPIGAALTESLPGSSPMNFRVYVSHITLFPLLLIFLMVAHFYLIRTFNLSPTHRDPWATAPAIPEEAMNARFNEHALHVVIASILYYGWIAVLAFFVRAPLAGPPASEHAALKPPWPFLWMYGFENAWGVVATIFCSLAFFGLLALVPLIDRKRDRRLQARKPILILGGFVATLLVALSIYGWVTPAQTHTTHTHDEEGPHDSGEGHPHEGKEQDHHDGEAEDHHEGE